MARITIENMEFYAHHGCFKEETLIGTWFSVDVWLDADTEKAQRNDSLDDTVNYAEVYARIKEEMSVPSKLIEYVAQRILNRIFAEFPPVRKAGIKLRKINPPLGEKIGNVNVYLEQER